MTPLTKPVSRKTLHPFANYGPDRGRVFVVTLTPGDLLTLRPIRRRDSMTVALSDIYRWALLCRVNAAKMEKLRAIKAKKEQTRKTRALAREVARESKQA